MAKMAKKSVSAKGNRPVEKPAVGAKAKVEECQVGFRDPFCLKTTELRDDLQVSAAAISDILRKAHGPFVGASSKTGAAKNVAPFAVRQIFSERGFRFPLDSAGTAHRIALQITKGGAAKTTSAHAIGTRMSAFGAKVLLVDSDPQSNLTTVFDLEQYGVEIDEDTPILADLFEKQRGSDEIVVEDLIVPITPNLHLIPSTLQNSNMEVYLQRNGINIANGMARKFASVLKKYDYIIFDCAPALSTTNALISCFSDTIILPVYPDKLCMSGLHQTLGELTRLQEEFSTANAAMNGRIVFSRFDARQMMSVRYLSQLYDEFPDKMYKTYIRTSSALANSIDASKNLFEMGKSGVAGDYHNLVKEIIGLDGLKLRKKAPAGKRKAGKGEGIYA